MLRLLMQSEVVPLKEEKPESEVWWKLHLYRDSLFFLFMFFAISCFQFMNSGSFFLFYDPMAFHMLISSERSSLMNI
jgi:hypothetical protein